MNSPPKRAEKLHLYRPWIGQEEIDAVAETFRSGWIGTGQKTRDFERRFAETVGADEAVAVNSCTAALHLTLTAAGVGPGDNVLVPVYTFTATAEAALHAGAEIRFLDVNPTTLNVDPETMEAALNPKTKAVVPVHIAGYPCDMTALQQIADAHDLLLLDDAAHAVAGEHNDKRIGGIGHASAFSFYPTKHITSIEGGMATTNDRQLADAVRNIRYHAITRDAWTREADQSSANAEQSPAMAYDVTAQGYKCNMTDVQAAVGLAQLEKLDRQMEIRRRIARMYQDAFGDCGALETPPEPDNGRHAWHLYILKLNLDRLSASRDEFAAELEALNIGTAVHYIPLHRFTHYRERCRSARGDFPNAERLYRRVLSIPLWPGMDENDAEDVIRAVLWTAKKRRVKRIF
ncbi:MAG: DegT/DnrJ/EryC1/StrS family aminotransferase [Candidatus Poribacteria bacterium]|nr:DegT/DnrJ/EryC1/StrS family aminotransferase [Candidatus Poribacteria bacterium]